MHRLLGTADILSVYYIDTHIPCESKIESIPLYQFQLEQHTGWCWSTKPWQIFYSNKSPWASLPPSVICFTQCKPWSHSCPLSILYLGLSFRSCLSIIELYPSWRAIQSKGTGSTYVQVINVPGGRGGPLTQAYHRQAVLPFSPLVNDGGICGGFPEGMFSWMTSSAVVANF